MFRQMPLLVLFVGLSLADGRRTQMTSRPSLSSSSDSSLLTDGGPVSVQPETSIDAASIPPASAPAAGPAAPAAASVFPPAPLVQNGGKQQTTFEQFAQVASLIQEQASMTQKLKDAINSAKVNLISPEGTFSPNSPMVFGIVIGSGLVVLVCFACCLAEWFRMLFPHQRHRMPYLHNGRVVYEWDQTPKVATIYIRPPEGVKKSDLDIRIAARHLKVGRKGKPSFLKEETYDLVNERMSSWSLRSNGELQIFLHKVRKDTWPVVLLHKSVSRSPGSQSNFAESNSKSNGPPSSWTGSTRTNCSNSNGTSSTSTVTISGN